MNSLITAYFPPWSDGVLEDWSSAQERRKEYFRFQKTITPRQLGLYHFC